MEYKDTMNLAQPGDLVYCDPPYSHSQAILYGAQSFSLKQLILAIDECKKRGVYVALRACPKLTSHFPIRAKVSLSPSKGNFCGLGSKTRSESPFDTLRVISRWSRKYKVVFGRLLSIDGTKRSGKTVCGLPIPDGLFEREVFVNIGRSMLKRFQMNGKTLEGEVVKDRLLLTY
jgi:hypothetical protein